MNDGWKAYAEDRPEWMGAELWIRRKEANGKISILKDMVFETIEDGQLIKTEDSFPMRGEFDAKGFMQSIMDAAWRIGMRPEGWEGSEGQVRAMRDHLEDMRTLALHRFRK
ncbi:hypothetical protein LCGC14_2251570 [marine sediment metagenome]|uniref:Uncharacterized protein n=1 Tax=marine sediment metagenome TaxID=412755 RepID=A0A0F9D2T5_9ZZZZ